MLSKQIVTCVIDVEHEYDDVDPMMIDDDYYYYYYYYYQHYQQYY